VDQLPPGEQYLQAFLPLFQSGGDQDLVFTTTGLGNTESLQNISQGGHLADLSGTAWASRFAEDNPTYEGLWRDGHLYGMPLTMINVGLIYNQAALDENGLKAPDTFDELLAICDKAVEIGKRAVGVSGASAYYFFETMAIPPIFNDTPDWNEKRAAGEVTFSSTPGWRVALERIQTMIDRDCFPVGVQSMVPPQLFAELAAGNVLMAVGPTTLMGAAKALNPALDLHMRPVPAETADKTIAVGMINDALSITQQSTEKDAALAFLDWLVQPEQMEAYQKVGGGTPPHMLEAGSFPSDLTDMAPFYAAGRFMATPHHHWVDPRVRSTLTQLASNYFAGGIGIDQFLAEMDAAWDQK
jgi:raffinose/stachyose/melibiose transport system substrate-binding protein